MTTFNIEQVVQRCLGGDESAMLRLVQQYQGQVFGLCYRMLGQRQDAEDAAQETFVRVLRHLHKWDSSRRFEPWLLAIAGNRCRTIVAKRMRAPHSEPLHEDELADDQYQHYAAQHLAEELQLALGEVRDDYREAFLLFHDHGCTYLEIAAAMEVPVGTVKTWVHRVRKELIAQLQRRNVLTESGNAVRTV